MKWYHYVLMPLEWGHIQYCKSGNFRMCNFSRFSDLWLFFCLFLMSRFSAILHRPTRKNKHFRCIFIFALAQKCAKSAKINVARKFPLLQYSTQSEQIIRWGDKQTNTTKLNWLVYNVGSYGEIEHSSYTCCMVQVVLGIGYLATLVQIGLLNGLYNSFGKVWD